ncbi:hypothetical protein EDD22DRAFT_143072 [Suillus occidentalis]|nr:hypothetical protein EDD22DRAFT_143072 [Suillus occidentalis]
MGRSDENVSFNWKTPTLHIPAAQLGSPTLLVEQHQRQNISPLLVSNQSRRDSVTASRSSENVPRGPPPRYYEQLQSRGVLTHFGAVGGSRLSLSSAHTFPGVGSTAHFPGGVLNRDFLIEDSMQPLQDIAFQSPEMVVPSYTTNATTRSHGGNTIHTSRLQHVTSPSGVGRWRKRRELSECPPQVVRRSACSSFRWNSTQKSCACKSCVIAAGHSFAVVQRQSIIRKQIHYSDIRKRR